MGEEVSPYDYDAHVARVNTLKEGLPGTIAQYRQAFTAFADALPIPEDLWLQWLSSERQAGSAAHEDALDTAGIRALFDRAVSDAVLSAGVWLEYAAFVDNAGDGENPEEVKEVYERAVATMGNDPAAGGTVWKAYAQFLADALEDAADDGGDTVAAAKAVQGVHLRMVRVPSADTATALRTYREVVLAGEELPADVLAASGRAAKQWTKKEPFEASITAAASALTAAEASGDGVEAGRSALASAWQTYIDVEVAASPARGKLAFNRAVTQCYWSAPLWGAFVGFADAVMAGAGDAADPGRTPAESALSVHLRAVKSCLWMGSLWAGYALALERHEASLEDVVAVLHRALAIKFYTVADYVTVLETLAQVHRRHLAAAPTPDARAQAVAAARAAVTDGIATACGHYPAMDADMWPVRRYWAVVEGETLKDAAASEALWDVVLAAPAVAATARCWLEAISFARGAGNLDRCRALFRTALLSVTDARGAMCDAWEAFEREAGTLTTLADAKFACDNERKVLDAAAKAEEAAAAMPPPKPARGDKPKVSKKRNRKEDGQEAAAAGAGSSAAAAPEDGPAKRARTGGEEEVKGEGKTGEEAVGGGSGTHSVFIKNLAFSVTEDDLRTFFGKCGTVKNVTVVRSNGRPRGLGYVDFAEESAVEAAVQMSGTALKKRNLLIEKSLPRSARPAAGDESPPDPRTVHVSNLPLTADETMLRATFEACGDIEAVVIAKDKRGIRKGFAYVFFKEEAGATAAVDKTGTIVDGAPTKVVIARSHARKTLELEKLKALAPRKLVPPALRRKGTLNVSAGRVRPRAEVAKKAAAGPTAPAEPHPDGKPKDNNFFRSLL